MMLHWMFAVINSRNTDTLELRSMSTRSLVLSVLLGSHPPRLPLAALVAFCGLFEIRPGTVRTALSRMSAAGDVVQVERADGSAAYEVAGPLLDRQRQQDVGRVVSTIEWDGRWITAVVVADARPVAERRRFRSRMVGAKMGELRPDVWMRPGNLEAPRGDDGLVVSRGALDGPPDVDLVHRLWDLPTLDRRSGELLAALRGVDGSELAHSFVVLAATLNHLRIEPQLPATLRTSDTADRLRTAYATVEQRFRRNLRAFLAEAR
jgi:phenylacetic acid degradation operon negative regulatory protein